MGLEWRHHRLITRLAVLAAMGLIVASCAGEDAGEEAAELAGDAGADTDTDPDDAPAADDGDDEGDSAEDSGADGDIVEMEITVTHWPTLLYGVPYLAAMEQGHFEDAGIEITGIVTGEGGGTTVRNVLTGGLPFGEVATPAAANAYLAGAPVAAVGGGGQSVAELNFVTNSGDDFTSIEDVAGHSVGYTNPGSVTEGALSLSLQNAGVDAAEVDDVAMGGVGEGLTGLQGGAVDVAANMEPIYSDNPDPFDVVWWVNEYVPDFQQTVIITSPELIEDDPDLVTAFLEARANGVEWVADNPDEAAALWAEEADLEEAAAASALEVALDDDWWGVGFTAEGIDAVDEQMRLIELVDEDEEIPWADFIDQDHLPEGAEAVDIDGIGQP